MAGLGGDVGSDYFDVDGFVTSTGTSTGAGIVAKAIHIPAGCRAVWILLSEASQEDGFSVRYNGSLLWDNLTIPNAYPFPLVGPGMKEPGGELKLVGTINQSTEFTITIGCKAVNPCP